MTGSDQLQTCPVEGSGPVVINTFQNWSQERQPVHGPGSYRRATITQSDEDEVHSGSDRKVSEHTVPLRLQLMRLLVQELNSRNATKF